jgi:amino acid adenylation domain-containing protein
MIWHHPGHHPQLLPADAPFGPSATIPELVAAQASRTPHATALEMDETLTYAALERRANRLARHLVRMGAGPETRVGVCLERGAELVIACLAVMKAGAAYVPLDPQYPDERLAYMMGDAGLLTVVTDGPHGRALPWGGPTQVRVDADRNAIDAQDDAPLAAPGLFPESLAYLVYTSGSTGKPKPVAVPHRPVARFLVGDEGLRVRAGDRLTQISSPSFDAFTFEVWAALSNGATVVGVPRDVAVDPAALAAELRRRRISVAFLTTALFHRVARTVPEALAGLRHVGFGGEAADTEAVRRAFAVTGPGVLINFYGPSEAATFSTWHPVDAVPDGAAPVPIGGAISETTLHVLDGRMRPVAPGTPGELYVGGEAPARGYHDRPAATAERFVPDPFSDVPGGRLYRTGDRVRRTPGGALEFIGRVDRQVKVRGFRVEPGEVEAVLGAHPAVRGCVVDARRESEGTWMLAAWAAADASVTPRELRAYLAERVPPYMVPGAIVVMDTLPISATGKIDRAALPDPSPAGGTFVEPATETEVAIAAIWAEVLGIDRVSADDDFLALGGHSLRVTQVIVRARAQLGVELTVRSLFAHSTVRTLAAEADRLRGETLEALLGAVEGMDDDEVMRVLAERGMAPA